MSMTNHMDDMYHLWVVIQGKINCGMKTQTYCQTARTDNQKVEATLSWNLKGKKKEKELKIKNYNTAKIKTIPLLSVCQQPCSQLNHTYSLLKACIRCH